MSEYFILYKGEAEKEVFYEQGGEGGGPNEIKVLSPGQVFGELALVHS